MIKSVNPYEVNDVFKKDASFYYVIPKYQREYTWNTSQWKDLYDDILENENGYFIGSIICIDNSVDSFKANALEVIDGQQRLTTLCLLLLAIYNHLKRNKDKLDEDNIDELTSLRKSLICKDSESGLILTPQTQNFNRSDFDFVIYENELIKAGKKEKNWGNRRIARSYKYFLQRIEDDLSEVDDIIQELIKIKLKVSKAVLVKIEVATHSEAYTLFESLNNRGTPLTAIDLMKNLILAKAEKNGISCDECFEKWQELLKCLTDDYTTQERFFRQHYNGFKNKLNEPFKSKGANLGYIATRSNLLSIYETLINNDIEAFLEDILICGEIYSRLILSTEEMNKFTPYLQELSRIQGSTSYLLLMYLFKMQKELELSDENIIDTIKLLTKFFVIRNMTDIPGTRDLNQIFMNIISIIEAYKFKKDDVYSHIYNTLVEKAASEQIFEEKLKGNIYEENVGVARFVLCTLAQKSMTHETWTDLWEKNNYNGKAAFKWTIEHIFPEGKNIPQSWINMIAGGDENLAEEYLEKYVHKLGNLTITGYNSTLSNSSFIDKRDRTNNQKKYVGYKNGLEINKEIALKEQWTIEDIEKRTDSMVKELLEVFKL